MLRSLALLAALTAASAGHALPVPERHADVIQLAQETEPPPRELEPRYQPVPPQPKSWYNDSYIFAMTRGVSDSTLVPAAKAPLYLLTVPLDLVLLPFASIGGLFG
ncbi:MAG: hypothetical protein ACRERC_11085 [Candidatus Binatia bacterium]